MTEQEAKVLAYITEYITERGFSPSYDEIKDHMGLRSKSGIFRMLNQLEGKGHIRRTSYRARAITLPIPADRQMVDSGFLCVSFNIAQTLDRGWPVAPFQLRELLLAYRRWSVGRKDAT